jgi:SAM-dependent methyltransferase
MNCEETKTMSEAVTLGEGPERMTVRALEGAHEMVLQTASRYLPQRGRALDLGAWSGALTKRLQAGGFEVVAADVENQFSLSTEFVKVDCNDPDFDRRLAGRFDLVAAVEVIEHLENPTAFLRSIDRLLNETGIAIVTTPNVDNAAARLKFFRSGKVRAMEANNPEHITPIHLDLFVRRTVPSAGLRLVERFVFPEGEFPLTGRRYFVALFKLAALLMNGPALTGDTHVFVLRKDSARMS